MAYAFEAGSARSRRARRQLAQQLQPDRLAERVVVVGGYHERAGSTNDVGTVILGDIGVLINDRETVDGNACGHGGIAYLPGISTTVVDPVAGDIDLGTPIEPVAGELRQGSQQGVAQGGVAIGPEAG